MFTCRLSHGFGQFGLGHYQYYHLIYDFSNFCLKVCIAQLPSCHKKKDCYPDIINDFMTLIQHLKQSITEIMDLFIPKANKPTLYVICPFCSEDVPPHIVFDINAPVLCCEFGDEPQELSPFRYVPCGIDLKNTRKIEGYYITCV